MLVKYLPRVICIIFSISNYPIEIPHDFYSNQLKFRSINCAIKFRLKIGK